MPHCTHTHLPSNQTSRSDSQNHHRVLFSECAALMQLLNTNNPNQFHNKPLNCCLYLLFILQNLIKHLKRQIPSKNKPCLSASCNQRGFYLFYLSFEAVVLLSNKKKTRSHFHLLSCIHSQGEEGTGPGEKPSSLSSLHLLLGDPEVFPEKIPNPSSKLWVFPSASYKWDVPGKHLKGSVQEASLSDA